jgi:CIC family chloride channel protein
MDWISSTLEKFNPLDRLRSRFRSSEIWFIGLAMVAGIAAGLLTLFQSQLAHRLQQTLFGLQPEQRLSAVERIPFAALLVLPVGGLLVGAITVLVRVRKRALVDAVEANALHGGRMSMRDSLLVSAQTIVSNGFGASVGLEAAYVQMGSGVASAIGRGLHVRRSDLRTLVGAGSAGAIAAAFGAPLTGAFYAFEIVMGTYTPATLAPVAAASLAAVLVAQAMGATPYLISVTPDAHLSPLDYALYIGLAAICAAVGIALMRLVAVVETLVGRSALPVWLRPAVGGLLLVPLAAYTPQILSSGHGALSVELVAGFPLAFVAAIFLVKCVASVLSLGFGFRGGLFFAAIFLGALAGDLYASLVNLAYGAKLLDGGDAAMVGIAALSASIIGAPLTIAMLVLEATHDFVLTSAAIAGALICNTLVRNTFGYSFSTWRLHLRGQSIKSARDVGWTRLLSAGQMMRAPTEAPAGMDVAEFRRRFPLGATTRVVLVDDEGRYAGIVLPAVAHGDTIKIDAPVEQVATNQDRFVSGDTDVSSVLKAFDAAQSDELAVVDGDGRVLGILSEAFVRKRYAEELEKHQRELFGER